MHAQLTIAALCSLGLGALAAAQITAPPAPAPGQGGVGAVDPALVERFLAESAPGSLAVHAVQGTATGPAIGAAEIEIEYYHNDRLFRQATAQLDGSGVVVLEDVPVALGVTPVVRLQHAGVTYVEVGPMMDAVHPEAVITLTVYETTDETPAWEIAMRHVLVEPSAEGARVAETLVVESPADRTWLGSPADAAGKRSTVRMNLPAGAREVHLTSGFHGWCCTTLDGDGEIAVQMPLMPGRTTFRYSYLVPPQAGAADITVSAPAPTRSAVFFVPDGAGAMRPVALEDAGPQQMGAREPARMFQGQSLAAGTQAGVILTGGGGARMAGGGGAAAHARLLALIGAGVLVLAAIAIFAARAAGARKAPASTLATGGAGGA